MAIFLVQLGRQWVAYQKLIDEHILTNQKYISKIYQRHSLLNVKGEVIVDVASTADLRLSINCPISRSHSGALGDASVHKLQHVFSRLIQ